MPIAERAVRRPQSDAEPISAFDVLASIGGVGYRWSIAGDEITWDGDVRAVLGIQPDKLATGRKFATFQDPDAPHSRHAAVVDSKRTDHGAGVPFQVEYCLRPAGAAGPTIWVEDVGRWYADGGAAPRRVVGVLRVVNERHKQQEQLEFRSSYDELTGFFNRAQLLTLLEQAVSTGKRTDGAAGFMIVAIDNFRLVNDCYGFDVGDQVLAVIANRIVSKLRRGDALGRFSGNKLGVILHKADDHVMANAAERILKAARDEVVVTELGSIAVTLSVGGVVVPRSAHSVAEATARAEESLHAARRAGHSRYELYVHSPRRETERRANAALSTELIGALERNRLRLAFQPIVDAKTRRPALFEALLRLERDNGEIVAAQTFMPLAERLGLSFLLDRRALELAIAALMDSRDLRISLNVTADSAAEPSWLAFLSRAVARHGHIANRLTVEITESSAIRNIEEAVRFVSSLKELGCDVAIDDFGAGYTSFRNLHQLDIDMVKIDGDFVENLASSEDDRVFVRTLVDLARHFELKTVAEWVRDERVVTILTELGVDYLQGDISGAPSFDTTWVEPRSAG